MRRAAALSASLALGAGTAAAQVPILARGKTVDVLYDTRDTGHPTEAYVARLFVPAKARGTPTTPQPLLVFLHGVNASHVRFHWAGGKPDKPDIRIVVSELIERGVLPPMLVAAPSTVVSSETPVALWPGFDLDRLVERTIHGLRGAATVDLERIVVVAHSGAGCNPSGGLASAMATTTLPVRAFLSVDTCMAEADARAFAAAPPSAGLFVSYQTYTWDRPVARFSEVFAEVTRGSSAPRAVDELRPKDAPGAHDALVAMSLERWVPAALSASSPRR